MTKLTKNKSGFTLIEIIIAIGLSSLLITAAFQLMSAASRSNAKASENIQTTNAVDGTMENIRLLTFSSYTMSITDADTPPSVNTSNGEDFIYCKDNSEIYAGSRLIGSAKQYGASSIELEFSADDALLTAKLTAKDADGTEISDCTRTLSLYLNSLDGGEGEIDGNRGNCIIYTTKPTSDS